FFHYHVDLHYLPSFPTRRSSDLVVGEVVVERHRDAVDEGLELREVRRLPHAEPGRGRRELEVSVRGRVAERGAARRVAVEDGPVDRKSTRLNSSHVEISYAVFCL